MKEDNLLLIHKIAGLIKEYNETTGNTAVAILDIKNGGSAIAKNGSIDDMIRMAQVLLARSLRHADYTPEEVCLLVEQLRKDLLKEAGAETGQIM